MKNIALCSAVLLGSVLGCTNTFPVGHPLETGMEEVNRSTLGRKGTVELRSGRFSSFTQFQATVDSAVWADLEAGERMAVPTADILRIRVDRGGRGILQGLGAGFLLGTAAGYLYWYASSADPCSGCNTLGFSAIIFGPLGGLAGIVAGAIRGTQDVYEMPPPP